ncbi:UbiA family prenyltransferase [Methylocystis sp. H62]|nr:UbiA family prenyltransferase [Methylocystis sp. H62]
MSKQAVSREADDIPALNCELALPLVLDLDGTLVTTDTLHEALLLLFKRDWSKAWRVRFWTLKGRAVVEQKLAEVVTEEDINRFPINLALQEFAEREAGLGREIVLATAADRAIAEKIQKRFSFISKVISSDGRANMRGRAKAEELRRLYPNGFIYAGDSYPDIHVWRHSLGAVFAGASPRLFLRVREVADIMASFPRRALGLDGLRRGLRLHQWAKNALIFVPLILGGKAMDLIAWIHALEAFLALSLLASATYLLNDLWDLHEDRQHWSKKHRPIASGELPIALSVGLIVACCIAALGLALGAGAGCVGMLALYLALSLSYSFRLKREPIIDVFLLATLFTMRLAIGVVVTEVAFSPWLIVFSMFIFLSLSLAKRQTEITRMAAHGQEAAPGRGYKASDAPFVLATGVATMMAAVLIMVIYLIEDAFPKGFYKHPDFLWGFAVIIFLWLARVWLLCHRGQLRDDPVAFALKDRLSLCYAAAMGAIFIAAVL